MNKLKNTIVEFHILQSMPVSCLNRDDVGSPKSAFIGGVNRARVSSQCWKRAVRLALHDLGVKLGFRTKNVMRLVHDACLNIGASEEQATTSAKTIAEALSKDTLLFVSQKEIEAFAQYAKDKNFVFEQVKEDDGKSKKGGKDKNPKKLVNELDDVCRDKSLDALDIARFGRMVATAKNMTVEAASSFSHAISTHKVTTELDFFTALDDLQDEAEQGGAHLGTSEFNSATYYRYISLNLGKLAENLGLDDTDAELLTNAIDSFVKAIVVAVPSARQHTMSAMCSWDYAKVLVRKGQGLQMSFEKPVKAKDGFLAPSVETLKQSISAKASMLGSVFGKIAEFEWGCDEKYSIDQLIADLNKTVTSLE